MIIKKAFTIARTGKPGVAAVDLPKDIQKEYGSDEYPVQRSPYSPEKIIREIFDLIRTFGNGKYEGKGEGVSLFWDRFQKMCDIQFKCNAILRI